MTSDASRHEQMAFDEDTILDPGLLLVLDLRDAAADNLVRTRIAHNTAAAVYSRLDNQARDAIDALELKPGLHRCGRYLLRIVEEKRITLSIERQGPP